MRPENQTLKEREVYAGSRMNSPGLGLITATRELKSVAVSAIFAPATLLQKEQQEKNAANERAGRESR